jgi:hypothetical protein
MTTNITLNKTFEVELDDNTTINVMVCLEVSTEDDTEDTQASQQIRCFTYDNVIEPLQDTLTELFTAEDMADLLRDDEDPEQKELEVIEFYKQGGHKQEVGDLLTADDYPECAE